MYAACIPGAARVFVQSGSAFTSVLIDCPGQAYAGILLGQEESFFCFCYLWVRGQSRCFSTQSQHFHFFSGTILKRWKKNWFDLWSDGHLIYYDDLWSDGHLIYYDDQTRQNVEDKVHMPVDCINIRMGHECRGKWVCRVQLLSPTVHHSWWEWFLFLSHFAFIYRSRRVSCRKR